MKVDVSDDLDVDGRDFALIVQKAKDLRRTEIRIEELERKLKQLKADKQTLETETLPDLMAQAGVEQVNLRNGYQLIVKPEFRASLPAASTIARAEADERVMLEKRVEIGKQWLVDNGGDSIIRSTLAIDLGKGASKTAISEISRLALKHHFSVDQTETIHPNSLSSFLKEKLAAGIAVPFEVFGVYDGKRCKIKPPKKGRNGNKKEDQ